MATSDKIKGMDTLQPVADASSRRVVAAYPTYAEAERAVDSISDQDFAVEHLAIVGKGLRSVEQVAGRTSRGRAALPGAGYGAGSGCCSRSSSEPFLNGPDFGGLLLYSVIVGVVFGAMFGLLSYAFGRGGQRDFASDTSIVAGSLRGAG